MNNKQQLVILYTIMTLLIGLFIYTIYYVNEIASEKEEQFYDTREVMRDVWDCNTLKQMMSPMDEWEHRQYANSLWIVKKCWTELEVISIEKLLGDDSK